MTIAPAPSVRLRTIAAATTALVLLAVLAGCGRLRKPADHGTPDRYAVLLDQLPAPGARRRPDNRPM
jgi:hypothetical protein